MQPRAGYLERREAKNLHEAAKGARDNVKVSHPTRLRLVYSPEYDSAGDVHWRQLRAV